MVEPDRAQVDPNATESFDMDWVGKRVIFKINRLHHELLFIILTFLEQFFNLLKTL